MEAMKRTTGELPEFAVGHIDLAQPRLGAQVVHATDDFFGDKSRLIKPEEPVFIPDRYDDHGKWMDGWESRRRRDEGHDHCTVRLGVAGIIRGVDIDTRHFTGNHPPAASVEACSCPRSDPDDATAWEEIVPASRLEGNSRHFFPVSHPGTFSHLRLHIYPDGGVARLRVYGEPRHEWRLHDAEELVDLAAMVHGGRPVAWNDAHFGHPSNLLAPGRGIGMRDGWETRRRREPGNDWAIIALGHSGTVERVEVDTAHFKGNFPESCSLQADLVAGGAEDVLAERSTLWPTLVERRELRMDSVHVFEGDAIEKLGQVSHVRFNIFPDGGVSRLRLFGRVAG